MRHGQNWKGGMALPGVPVPSLCVRPARPAGQAWSFRRSYPSLGIGSRWSRSDRLPETRFLSKTWFLRPLAGEVDGSSGVQSNNYWSSTTNANNTSNAWNVNLNDGNVNNDDKTNSNYVWPVRGGE